MVPHNVIVFGAPTIDRGFALKLAGATNANSPSPTKIFKTRKHSVTISEQQYTLYDTAGLNDCEGWPLEARETLGNLYHFIRALDGGINLLIYVFHDQPSLNNIKLFHDYLCRGYTPIIIVTTNPNHPPSMPDGFPLFPVLSLDNTVSRTNKAKLRKAITTQINKRPTMILPMDRFELTTKESWKLLEKAACWSLADCREALKDTFMEDASLTEEDANARCQDITEYIKKHYFCNVIVFGDTGAGKTSVIRMLTDQCELDTSKASSAGGSTFQSQAYNVDIGEYHYVFHDTVGLDDATSASISPQEAIRALYQLILKVDGGVSLLVYVHRGKIKPHQIRNYRLFSHVICESKVPTVLVITGLEQEDSRDDWWVANKCLFNAKKIETKFHACITSSKGKFDRKRNEFKYQDEYEESREVLTNLFLTAPLVNPWKVTKTPSFWNSLVVEVYNMFAAKFNWGPLASNQWLYQSLMSIVEMTDSAAMALSNEMARVLPKWMAEESETGSTSELSIGI